MPRAWARARRNLPLVAVIIDTVGKPAGPATWRSAAALIAWAEIAVLQRQASVMGHYAYAAELAKTHLKVLLIEAPAEWFEDWLELLQRRAELVVEVIRP